MLLYGMTAHNFAPRFNMSLQEAQEFVDQFKAGLPVLTTWISAMENLGEKQGYIKTMFGRPRRVKSWFDTGEWKWINFAKRTIVNSAVQGTGADILKLVMIRIFNKFYKDKPMTELIRFKSTIHDEINYQVYKDKEHNYKAFNALVKATMQMMRVKLDGWPFPMEVGLSIGNRWGQSVDFDFNPDTLEILGPKKELATDSDICKSLGINLNKLEEVAETEPNIEDLISEEWNGETLGTGDGW